MAAKAIPPLVVPNVGPVATMPAKLNVINVLGCAALKNVDKFVLGSIKRTHAAAVFHPNADILQNSLPAVVISSPWRQSMQAKMIAPSIV